MQLNPPTSESKRFNFWVEFVASDLSSAGSFSYVIRNGDLPCANPRVKSMGPPCHQTKSSKFESRILL